jgi:hypothetical protein
MRTNTPLELAPACFRQDKPVTPRLSVARRPHFQPVWAACRVFPRLIQGPIGSFLQYCTAIFFAQRLPAGRGVRCRLSAMMCWKARRLCLGLPPRIRQIEIGKKASKKRRLLAPEFW